MYAIYGNIDHECTPNVSIYTIHGSFGYAIYGHVGDGLWWWHWVPTVPTCHRKCRRPTSGTGARWSLKKDREQRSCCSEKSHLRSSLFFLITWPKLAGWWFGCHFLFSHVLGIIIPIDFHIFQRGGPTTNQLGISDALWLDSLIDECPQPILPWTDFNDRLPWFLESQPANLELWIVKRRPNLPSR